MHSSRIGNVFKHIYTTCTLDESETNMCLKELEHRKLGWNVLLFKYDLGKSLRKKMGCKLADTKNNFDYIF